MTLQLVTYSPGDVHEIVKNFMDVLKYQFQALVLPTKCITTYSERM